MSMSMSSSKMSGIFEHGLGYSKGMVKCHNSWELNSPLSGNPMIKLFLSCSDGREAENKVNEDLYTKCFLPHGYKLFRLSIGTGILRER